MSKMYNPVSMNDAQPILAHSTHSDVELQPMTKHAVVKGEEVDYVTVTAPTNLPAGYELIVDVMDGSFWTVQVPEGGVAMNETMRAKVLHKTHVAKAELVSSQSDSKMYSKHQSKSLQFDIPTGRWRDGIFDCCIIPMHPVFFATYCYPLITLGQVMTRIKFNFCGGGICPRAFYVMLTVTIVKIILPSFFGGFSQFISAMRAFNVPSSGGDVPAASVATGLGFFQNIYVLGFLIFYVVVHTMTRNRIRRAYSIGNDMFCLGDCCCAFWCSACSVCQMARHTANYHNTHRARCCTPNGLDEEWDDYDFFKVTQNDHASSRSAMPMMV